LISLTEQIERRREGLYAEMSAANASEKFQKFSLEDLCPHVHPK